MLSKNSYSLVSYMAGRVLDKERGDSLSFAVQETTGAEATSAHVGGGQCVRPTVFAYRPVICPGSAQTLKPVLFCFLAA